MMGTHIVGWEPFANEKDGHFSNVDSNRCVRQAVFVDSEHVATSTVSSKFALWSIPDCRAVYFIDTAPQWIEYSPTRKYMAIPKGGAIRFIDVLTGEPHADLPVPNGMAVVAFHPDGEHFAAVTGDHHLVSWNLKTGRVESEFAIPRAARHSHDGWAPMQFCGDKYLLLGHTLLADLQRKAIVWKYELPLGMHLEGSPDTRHWFLTSPGIHSSDVHLVAATLPKPAVEAKLAELASFKPEMVIEPGCQVTLELTISVKHPQRPNFVEETRKDLVAALRRNQATVADGQRTVIRTSLEDKSLGETFDIETKQVDDNNAIVRKKVSVPNAQLIAKTEIIRGRQSSFRSKPGILRKTQCTEYCKRALRSNGRADAGPPVLAGGGLPLRSHHLPNERFCS